MDLAELQTQQLLHVRKRTLTPRYEVRDARGTPVAFVRRIWFKPALVAYHDRDRQAKILDSARKVEHDIASPHIVTDHDGTEIGRVRPDLSKLLAPKTWRIEQPGLGEVAGRERSGSRALLRFTDSLSWLPSRFDYAVEGRPAFSVRMKGGPLTRLVVKISDPSLDRRLVIAAVLLL